MQLSVTQYDLLEQCKTDNINIPMRILTSFLIVFLIAFSKSAAIITDLLAPIARKVYYFQYI